MKVAGMKNSALLPVVLLSTYSLDNIEAQQCRPSGQIRGRKPPPSQCNQENESDCFKDGKHYTTYKCSPQVSSHTEAFLTLNSFEAGGDRGGSSECDKQYHSDDTPVVALSTGWFNHKSRCHYSITITGNGRSIAAMVVDECDSTMGCDEVHDYSPPVTHHTEAYLILNSFEKNGDGGGPYELTTNSIPMTYQLWQSRPAGLTREVGVSTKITIRSNGLKVKAMGVDECDSMRGCDETHDYQPPCDSNIVDASRAVRVALGVPSDDWGGLDITWSDA